MSPGNVATIGTFDLMHQGHLELFRFCSELSSQIPGSRVIVGVNTDGFIFRYKGQLPILSFRERAALVDACKYVSESSANPQDGLGVHSVRSFLERQEVRYLVVGSDWVDRDYLGQIGMTRSELEELNITLIFKPYHPGISTTDIRTRIATRVRPKVKPKGHGTLVVVPAHNPNHLLRQAISGLKNFVVVDNGSTSYEGYEGAANIEANQYGPTYEMGALLHAFHKYDYDRYLLLQDSIVLRDLRFVTSPESFFDQQAGVYALSSIHPASIGMTGENHAWIAERFPSLDLGSLNCLPGIQYNAFSATREQIQKLIDAKFLSVDNLPRDKVGSQSWERVLGLAFAAVGEPIHFLTTVSNTQHAVFEKTFLYRN